MDYKKSSRSPQYGKIFAFDKNGKRIEELDVLKLVLVHNGKEYKIKELLETVVDLEAELAITRASEAQLTKGQEELKNKFNNMSEALRILNKRVRKLESDKNLL